MPRKSFDPDKVKVIEALWFDPTVSVAEIARRVGLAGGNVHRAGVVRWGPRERYAGAPRPWTEAEVAEARRLMAGGASRAEAARRLGRDDRHLGRILRNGLSVRLRAEGKRDRAVELLRAGLTAAEVARRLKVGDALVLWWRRQAGLPEGATVRGAKIRAAFRRPGTHNKNASRAVRDRLAALDAGWPLCGPADRRVLEALERVGEGTDVDVMRAAGYTPGCENYVGRVLRRCWQAGWVARGRARYHDCWRYRLAEAVADRRREAAHAQKKPV